MAAVSRPCCPVFIDMQGRRAVVIGGGKVAERKVDMLLGYGADVEVVSPAVTQGIAVLAEANEVSWSRRAYETGDLAGARLVVCACGVPAINEAVHAEAQRVNCLANVVDVPHLCDFIVPATVRRGPLQVAVSTSGAAAKISLVVLGQANGFQNTTRLIVLYNARSCFHSN